MKKKQEVKPSCCAMGGMTEEVHVLKSECPVSREFGSRKFTPIGSDEEREESTCIYISSFDGVVVPKCEHYGGCKQVQRDKKKVWRVFCSAVQV